MPSHDVVGAERPFTAPEFAQEDHLQEQIAQLFAQIGAVAGVDGVDDFARFFEHVLLEARDTLLAVPGTPVGGQEALHQLDEPHVRGPF